MLDIRLKQNSFLKKILIEERNDFSIQTKSYAEKVKLLIIRDLLRIGWEIRLKTDRVLIRPPKFYDKQIVKESMQIKRQELLLRNEDWINKHIGLAKRNLADGAAVWESKIDPIVEVCETQPQLDLFRIFRFYWSSPYSEYVGRRIKLLIRDNALANKPIIGIAALGSSIVHIPARDKWIGWETKGRTKNLVFTMDAYVLGALPPYNYLLGGKLVSYIIASNEVRKIYERKYKGKVTNIAKRKANRLACIFTTSLYGKSSQYNRVKYDGNLIYVPIGQTKGYGTLHLTNETFEAMRSLIKSHHVLIPNRFGDGPIWRMRVIRTAADILGFDSDFLLKHSFQRKIYAVPLAHNCREFLRGENKRLCYCNYPMDDLIRYWKARWLTIRKTKCQIKNSVNSFRAEDFSIF